MSNNKLSWSDEINVMCIDLGKFVQFGENPDF
jgi:hypothetical protein